MPANKKVTTYGVINLQGKRMHGEAERRQVGGRDILAEQ